jgi:hypothetical protein
MQVYEIEVTFMRKRQPKEYENAQAQVTLKASLEDGESCDAAIGELMASASNHVYSQLGLNVAQGTQSATTKTTDGQSSSKGKSSSASKGKSSSKKTEPAPSDDLPDDGGETAPAASTSANDDVPGDEPPAEAPKEQPKQEKPADDVPAEAPKKQAESSSGPTHGEVQSLISKMVKDKVCSVQDCKGILKEYGVDRTQDLPADKLSEVKDRIEALGL